MNQEGYRNFNLKSLTEEEERFIKKLVDRVLAEVAPKPESFQILKVEDKEESFSSMETKGKENRKNSMEIVECVLKQEGGVPIGPR